MKILSSILLIIGLIGMVSTFIWIVRKGSSKRSTMLFAVCQTAIILWILSQLLILYSTTLTQYRISYFIGNTGISIFSPFWLMFCIEYSEFKGRLIKISRFFPLVTVTALTLVVTNPLHHLYYSEFGVNVKKYAMLFYVFQFIYYSLILAGIIILCLNQVTENKKITKQIILLVMSTGIPLFINTLTITGITKNEIELTPLFFAFSSIMIAVALSRYGLLNINSTAMQDITDTIGTGIIIFDARDNISYINNAAKEILNKDFTNFREFSSFLYQITGTEYNMLLKREDIEINKKHYSFSDSFCFNKSKNKIARIISVNDITEYYELADTEKKLSLEQERNRIAQEIHDSAGHTFTMISSIARILEAETAAENYDTEKCSEYLKEIDGLSRSGITQLRCSINNLREDSFLTTIKGAVKTVADAVRNAEVEVSCVGEEDERYAFCTREVYDNCRETITNTMRYAEADKIDIVIKFMPEMLEIYIFDNGKGCKEIKENNGLKGIRERTERIGGEVKFASLDGFSTIMKIPVRKAE